MGIPPFLAKLAGAHRDASAPRTEATSILRIAVVSTPRSGNTWLRSMLGSVFAVEQLAFHSPADVPWANLPERCLLQIHWRRDAAFISLLRRHGFRVVVLARHPLDVLISILHFAPHEPQTARWLEGDGGDESSILGMAPRSPAFLAYATGPRAASLLSVSRQWWRADGVLPVRYEDLVSEPVGEMERLVQAIGAVEPIGAIADQVAAHTLERLRPTSGNQHFWQGRPGLWRALIPAAEAGRIARAHRAVFRTLGYRFDPDRGLDAARADENWRRLRAPAARSA